MAFTYCDLQGRGGLGSIFVCAAGDGGIIVEDSCAFNGYVNNIYTIAITGINRDGSIPGYGEHCAGIMAVTYSRDVFGDTGPVVGWRAACLLWFALCTLTSDKTVNNRDIPQASSSTA